MSYRNSFWALDVKTQKVQEIIEHEEKIVNARILSQGNGVCSKEDDHKWFISRKVKPVGNCTERELICQHCRQERIITLEKVTYEFIKSKSGK